jgi:hypothetical protein
MTSNSAAWMTDVMPQVIGPHSTVGRGHEITEHPFVQCGPAASTVILKSLNRKRTTASPWREMSHPSMPQNPRMSYSCRMNRVGTSGDLIF